ncbi:MAG: hypothetical protein HY646_13885 [Acidobacteria bacterium]|nr:hypothetical protein [Acidobacteriota bacterium]
MSAKPTFEQIMRRYERRRIFDELLSIDVRLFDLETTVRHLEVDFRYAEESDLPRLRRKRADIRFELELLKVDFESIERRARRLPDG